MGVRFGVSGFTKPPRTPTADTLMRTDEYGPRCVGGRLGICSRAGTARLAAAAVGMLWFGRGRYIGGVRAWYSCSPAVPRRRTSRNSTPRFTTRYRPRDADEQKRDRRHGRKGGYGSGRSRPSLRRPRRRSVGGLGFARKRTRTLCYGPDKGASALVCGGLQHPMVAKSGEGSLAPVRPLGRSVRTVVFVGHVGAPIA